MIYSVPLDVHTRTIDNEAGPGTFQERVRIRGLRIDTTRARALTPQAEPGR